MSRIRDARLRDQLHGVLVQRHDRVRVLRSGVAVDDRGQIHLEVESASIVGISPSSFAAMMTHCRCLRLPVMYILIVLIR